MSAKCEVRKSGSYRSSVDHQLDRPRRLHRRRCLHGPRRRGIALIYGMFLMVAVAGFCSLGVEIGRVQLAKTELQRAADAASRYGGIGLANSAAGGRANAMVAAADNTADGTSVVLLSSDIEFGSWNSATKTFTVATGSAEDSANSIRVTARRTKARGNPVSLIFARIVGANSCDVTAVSIATLVRGAQTSAGIPATSNPFLAGMPAGTVANPVNPHNNPDHAGDANNVAQSPVNINSISIVPGAALSFDAISGGANNDPNGGLYGPDGNTGWVTNNIAGAEHGRSDVYAPINAVMGIFLDDSTPQDNGPVPPTLDFSSQAARDFTSLSPKLNQVFFIGDGRTSDGVVQQIIIPGSSTRLFIGTMDQYEWNNNIGSYTVTIHQPAKVSLVK